jgi:hypothetical protein
MTGFAPVAEDPQQQLGADHAGVEDIVRLVRCPTTAVAVGHDLLGDVGMVIEPEDDGDVGPENLPAERDLLALDIVDALGGAGAVQLQRQPVDGTGRPEPLADLGLEVVEGLPRCARRPPRSRG